MMKTNHLLRNQMLYPAELRGQQGFPPFMGTARSAQAEQNGAAGHSAAHRRHNFGHTPPPTLGIDKAGGG